MDSENDSNQGHDHYKTSFNTLVIGAGASGLAAASHLKKQGLTVCVLEARDRMGGRLHSIPFGKEKKMMDLGGQWIHGRGPGSRELEEWVGKLNPVYQIALENKIDTVKTWLLESRVQKNYWWKGGQVPYDVWGIVDQIEALIDDVQESASDKDSIAELYKQHFTFEQGSDLEKVY